MPKPKKPVRTSVEEQDNPAKIAPALADLIHPIADFEHDPENARLHPEKNMEAIKASLSLYGQLKPIVVRKQTGIVVAGNGTMAAARELGWKTIAASVVEMTEEEAIGYGLADNRTAELAEWDFEVTSRLTKKLEEFGHETIGWSLAELQAIYETDFNEEVEENKVPELPAVPITEVGDIWILGQHRLLCGDATRDDHVSKLINGQSVDLLLTDPPYGVSYVGKTADALTIENDALDDDAYRDFLGKAIQNAVASLRPGGGFYIFHADSRGLVVRLACNDAGLQIRQCLVWVKQSMVLGRQDYQWRHEPCLYGWKDGAAHNWFGDRSQTTVLEFDRPTKSTDHPTTKPVNMLRYLISNSCPRRGIVLDPFGGSGSTLIAAEVEGRRAYLLEFDPKYADVIVRRWEQHTGKKASRQSAGKEKS